MFFMQFKATKTIIQIYSYKNLYPEYNMEKNVVFLSEVHLILDFFFAITLMQN